MNGVPPRPAVFLDRDGTIIEDPGYLSNAGQVRLLPGSARAIVRLNSAGLLTLVVSNQSGIARGLLSLEDYRNIERQLNRLLSSEGAWIDGHYFCPHYPEVNGPCECRKPGTLLYRQAAERFGIDLKQSWWVGDRVRDLVPAESFGGHGVLVLTGAGPSELDEARRRGFPPARDLAQAVETILTTIPVNPSNA